MKPKYYNPKLEAFHIGFEYEVIEMCSINGGPKQLQWNKKIMASFGNSKFDWRIKKLSRRI